MLVPLERVRRFAGAGGKHRAKEDEGAGNAREKGCHALTRGRTMDCSRNAADQVADLDGEIDLGSRNGCLVDGKLLVLIYPSTWAVRV